MKKLKNILAALFVGVSLVAAPAVHATAFDSASLISAANAEVTGAQSAVTSMAPLLIGIVAAATVVMLIIGWVRKARTAK